MNEKNFYNDDRLVNREDNVPLILIGGASVVGKTTMVRKLLKIYPYYSLSIDDLKYMIRKSGYIEKQLSSRDFYYPKTWMDKVRKRDFELWQWTKEYISSSLSHNLPLIVEGGLWADYVNESINDFVSINNKVKIVTLFIVDSTDDNEVRERLLNLKKSNPYKWLNKYDKQQISLYVKCNKLRTDNIVQLANNYNYLVYDINDYESMDKMQEVIINDIRALIDN